MKRTAPTSLSLALALSGSALADAPAPRPSAAQLLDVPVSGNPIGDRPAPSIRNPYADDANAIVQGEKLFAGMNCNGCHAPLGGGGMGPPLSDRDWIYGGEPAAIYLSIAQGRPNGMPAWGRNLPPTAIWSLVAYIQTLSSAPAPVPGTPQKPAPNPLGLP
jgi:cytochrome c oxidase cbb3-type subunit 3